MQNVACPIAPEWTEELPLTHHGFCRMSGRGLSPDALEAALAYGRVVRARGAALHVVGRKEVARFRKEGIDLAPYEGIQVVCANDDTILTVYRNRDFRGLRPRRRRGGAR